MCDDSYTVIGQVINSHGLKGTVKIYPYTDDINRFSKLKYIFLGEEHKKLEIEHIFFRKNLVYINFKGLNSIELILPLKEKYVYILKKDRVSLKENSYYIDDIIGFSMKSLKEEELGILVDVLLGNANDVFVAEKDKNTFYIPVVKQFIKKVDLNKKIIYISPIEGMFD